MIVQGRVTAVDPAPTVGVGVVAVELDGAGSADTAVFATAAAPRTPDTARG